MLVSILSMELKELLDDSEKLHSVKKYTLDKIF